MEILSTNSCISRKGGTTDFLLGIPSTFRE
jgi:hypothetical protein